MLLKQNIYFSTETSSLDVHGVQLNVLFIKNTVIRLWYGEEENRMLDSTHLAWMVRI